MQKLILQSFSDSNMAGYDWVVNVVLTQRKNGYFSLRATQITDEPPIYKTPLIYPIKNGSQLKLAIEEVFQDDLISHIEIEWQEIINNLEKLFPKLANQLRGDYHAQMEETFTEGIEMLKAEILEDEERKKNKHLYDWLDKSSWPKSTLHDPMGIGARIENKSRRTAVFQYVKNYFDNNNSFPIGKHSINETVKGGSYVNLPTKFNFVVNFPEST